MRDKPLRGFSKTMHLRIKTTLFLLYTANFFRSTKPIENSKESMIAELKKPLNTIINTSYSQREIRRAYF